MIQRPGRFATPRTALVLYGLMLVVPAGVFGALYWSQLQRDQDEQAARAPMDVNQAASRMRRTLAERIATLMFKESARPFSHYSQSQWEGSDMNGMVADSPLKSGQRPDSLLLWFSFPEAEGIDPRVEYFFGDINEEETLRFEAEDHLKRLVNDEAVVPSFDGGFSFLEAFMQTDPTMKEIRRNDSSYRSDTVPISSVAYFLHPGDDQACAQEDLRIASQNLPGRDIQVSVFDEQHSLTTDIAGNLRLLSLRRVRIHGLYGQRGFNEFEIPECLDSLINSTDIYQGWVADADYLLRDLPQQVAELQLSPDQQLFFPDEVGELDRDQWALAAFPVLHGLGIDLGEIPVEANMLWVGTDVSSLEQRFRSQKLWFLGLALVLGSSVALGLRLLIGRVRSAAEAARRTENFVASITHELRTPLAAVKMYGEMLSAGWATTAEKQQDYADRIVHESNRLDTMVDRVLEKRRLSGAPPDLAPLDLNAELRREELSMGLHEDPSVQFELAEGLPPVLLTEEAVHALVSNLVENAKKYAPVNLDEPGAEPILVRSRRNRRGKVVLEVLDRGPGIPPAERENVFGAFYRMGDEATRTTQGTGLGLHLVAQYARVLKGKVAVFQRESGGARFQVTFRTAK